MTWDEFESELNIINGVFAFRETSGKYEFLVVSVRGRRIDYFLILDSSDCDKYMAYHYTTLVRMLAACI